MTATKDHGVLGQNIKIHFAGAEGVERAFIAHDAGVNYFLFTVLPFIAKQFNISWGYQSYCKNLFPQIELPKIAKHVIMDSGLFSLMFGAAKDTHPDAVFINRWMDAICQFVHDNKAYSLTCVECDCQKLLGVDLAWQLREKMRKQIPNRIINVFHYEDGKKGLDRLIEFAEYIAISVPELRIVKPKTYKEDTYRLASYIKEKKPEIDIHLLGGTEFEMVRRCKFCTSADSTSWMFANRTQHLLGYGKHQIKEDMLNLNREYVISFMEKLGIVPNELRINNFLWLSLIAKGYLKRYERYAGSQD